MVDILNIGRSGLSVYTTALAVTGENIANVDTDGYRRRELLTQEVPGGGVGVNAGSAMPSGVSVSDVRRAFDSLLADRNRTAASTLGMAEAANTYLSALETRVLPGENTIAGLVDGFFDALDGLSAGPGDLGLREVVLQSGRALAVGVQDMANGLAALSGDVAAEQAQALTTVNDLLTEMGRVQEEITLLPDAQSRNPLLDKRDAMLAELSQYMEVSTQLDEKGLATVRFGPDANGPLLLRNSTAARITGAEDGRLTITPAGRGATPATRSVENGALAGLAMAQGVIGQTISDFDAWATRLSGEMNELHARGLDMSGAAGGAMFSATGIVVTAGALNRGTAAVEAIVTDPSALSTTPLTLAYDAPTAQWLASDEDGNLLGQGAEAISLPGLRLNMAGGVPANGDRFTLTPQQDMAKHLNFLLQDGADIAAAGPLVVSPSGANSGTATVTARPQEPPESGLADLSTALGAAPVEFVSAGVVGVIPARSASAVLTAQRRDAALDIPQTEAETAHTLSMFSASTGLVDFEFPAIAAGPQAAADALNSGAVLSADGDRLSDLGLYAQAADGVLTILAREGTDLPTATLTTSAGNAVGVVVSDAAEAAQPMLFTRDGRQLSGAPLSAAEATALLTTENGFYDGAVYDTSYLNEGSGFGLMIQTRMGVDGAPTALVGQDMPILTWEPTTQPVPQPAGGSIGFDSGALTGDVTLPEGASAAWRADLISDALPLQVDAETRVELTLPATGQIALRIGADTTEGINIQANLANGGPLALAAAINAQTNLTGVRAETSGTGDRLVLVHDGGQDIRISNYRHDGAEALTMQRLDPANAALGGQASLTSGALGTARITGTVRVSGAEDFGLTENGLLLDTVPDGFTSGLMSLTSSAAGTKQTIDFAASTPGDTALRQIEIALPYGGTVEAEAFPLSGGTAPASAQQLASDMLADLRSQAPASVLTGAALSAIPADGAQMRVSLGDQDYLIRMQDGAPTVIGPEPDRLNASFNAAGQLEISTNGGSLTGAALRPADDPLDAPRFGMGAADGALTTVIGQPFDGANLPSNLTIKVGSTTYSVSVSAANIILPPNFPGTGYVNTTFGRVEIQFDSNSGPIEIEPQQGAADAGLMTIGAEGQLTATGFTLTGTGSQPLDIRATSVGQGSAVSLTNLPDDDLLVVMPAGGALRLSGAIDAQDSGPVSNRELRILDADSGAVGLFDADSGAFLASRRIDASGFADFGALSVQIAGRYQTGDTFAITPNTNGTGDARALTDLANLRQLDRQTGQGGYTAEFGEVLSAVGAQVKASEDKIDTAQGIYDSAQRANDAVGGVNLDQEAADLMRHQQAYQANAQVISVARQLFDTLLQSI